MNSAGTFIDILEECKRKNTKILGVRKLSRPATECDLTIYGILLILHLVYVFSRSMNRSSISFVFSRQRIYLSLVIDMYTPGLNALFVHLKGIKNGEAHKCLIKTHLLCTCRRTPM